MRIIIMSKSKKNKGVALFLVLGFIAVMVPVMYMFSQIGSSQTKQALKYHEHLRTELTAFSGNTARISRLRGFQEEFTPMPNEVSGDDKYSATTFKTGVGFLNQTLLLILTQSTLNGHSYSLMCDAEQFNPNPEPPVKVIVHDYWGTIEPYQISLLADALAMQNYRGMELVRLEETRDFERSLTPQKYREHMNAKLSGLPTDIKQAWSSSTVKMAAKKLPKISASAPSAATPTAPQRPSQPSYSNTGEGVIKAPNYNTNERHIRTAPASEYVEPTSTSTIGNPRYQTVPRQENYNVNTTNKARLEGVTE